MLTREVAPVDSEQNARTVREDTAELASYLLSDGSAQRRPSFLHRSRASVQDLFGPEHDPAERTDDDACASQETIHEVSEPPSPTPEDEGANAVEEDDGPSVLSNLLKRSPPQSVLPDAPISSAKADHTEPKHPRPDPERVESQRRHESPPEVVITEETPLLSSATSEDAYDNAAEMEGQKPSLGKEWFRGIVERGHKIEGHVVHAAAVAVNPRRWNRKAIWQKAILDPVACLPAVVVGLLLNILDALSYGEPTHPCFWVHVC